jgi:hypothetical protein
MRLDNGLALKKNFVRFKWRKLLRRQLNPGGAEVQVSRSWSEHVHSSIAERNAQ